jgi:trk system potassium uptake protein TrkH
VRFTLVVESAGAILLTARFSTDMPFTSAAWHGVFTSVSAFCNAGFDLNGGFRSLIPYQSSVTINFIVIALIQAGALSYLVWSDVVQTRRWNRLAIDTRLILIGNGILLLVGAVLFLLSEWNQTLRGQDMVTRMLASVFQSTSARSAGFQTVDLSQANDGTLFAYTGLMFIGGAPGSTAGGIKLTVAGVIIAAVLATLRGETETNLMKRRLPASVITRAVTITITMAVALFLVALALTISENRWGTSPQFLHILFDSASALGSVGLSSGITTGLSNAGKIVLSIAIVFGKVGPLTMAYALQRRQRAQRFSLPEAAVRMG